MDILVLNSGSSSLKYVLYRWEEKISVARGIVERVGIEGSNITHEVIGKETLRISRGCPSHRQAVDLIMEVLTNAEHGVLPDISQIKAVGHRVVHGGERFNKSVIIDDTAMKAFRDLAHLAPLHNPPNITGIEAAKQVLPEVPHVAIMDTAWHQTMPDYAYIYALPYNWYREHSIRRYGFHGTSLLYTSKRAAVLLGKSPFDTNLVIAHIGNGVSFNAVCRGVSVDTSMGFTPLEGAVMGTRAGDHDAAIDLYMMEKLGISPQEMNNMLNKKSGVLGITGKYIDRRDVIKAAEKGNKNARLALDIETYRAKKYIGAYCAALGHTDAVVFTAGVGEMSPYIRGMMVEDLQNMGISVDPEKNRISSTRNAETDISEEGSKVKTFVIPTDEELVMVEDTVALLEARYDVHTNFTYSFQDRTYVNRLREEAFQKELDEKPELFKIKARIP
ncbi:MAG: propionate kinase [Spirochaetes bacterium DG_61]|jgi:acetate kinase|nr:MAG: propionate kinase [Spirochaetes bacterium DG_61]